MNKSGIFTVFDLLSSRDIPEPALPHFVPTALAKLRLLCSNHLWGEIEDRIVDHRKTKNPYESRYGQAWEATIAKTTSLRGYVCVTEMISHMFLTTADSFKNTRFSTTFMVFHDALSLMTATDTQAWMKTQFIGGRSYHDIWLLPLAGLLSHTQRYKTSFPGNHPNFCPWDNSLNKDLHEAVAFHVIVTQGLLDSNPHKFKRNTPKLLRNSYFRLLSPSLGSNAGVPCGARICQDVGKYIGAVEAVVTSRGTAVEPTNGHRVRPGGKHGGHRVKGEGATVRKWVHPDAVIQGKIWQQ